MTTYMNMHLGVDATSSPRVTVIGGRVGVDVNDGALTIFGKREDVVAFAHRLVAALAPVEAELSQEALVRDALGITLEPATEEAVQT